MLIDLIDLVSDVDVDAGVRILLLDDSQCDLQRITRRDHDLVREETVEEALVEDRGGDLDASPEKLPATLAALENCSGDLDMCDFDDLPGRFVNRLFGLEQRKFVS